MESKKSIKTILRERLNENEFEEITFIKNIFDETYGGNK